MLERGQLAPEDVADFPLAHVILQAVGTAERVEVDLTRVDVSARNDVLLVCSDGLYGPVAHASLCAVLEREPSPDAACEALGSKNDASARTFAESAENTANHHRRIFAADKFVGLTEEGDVCVAFSVPLSCERVGESSRNGRKTGHPMRRRSQSARGAGPRLALRGGAVGVHPAD